MTSRTVNVFSFAHALPRPQDGDRVMVCEDPEGRPLEWVPMIFMKCDGRLPERAADRINTRIVEADGKPSFIIGEPGPWGVIDETTSHFADLLERSGQRGYWCDADHEVVPLDDLIAAGCTWMVPPEGRAREVAWK